MLKSFKEKLHLIDKNSFEQAAIELFHFQAVQNPVYAEYLEYLGIKSGQINEIQQIPFLPITLFKHKTIKSGNWEEETYFESSGTTGMHVSKHYIEDITYYHHNSAHIFQLFYGSPSNYIMLALLPSYLQRKRSSLVAMLDHLIQLTGSENSGFYLYEEADMMKKLRKLHADKGKRIMLFGVTYALLDLAEHYCEDLNEVIIVETGGMKGRREELIRQEVHERLKNSFNVPVIHSEYGMTELMSQAYSKGEGIYKTPPWMKVFTREINDPFSIDNGLSYGVINVIDLANMHSCAFIATEDLGSIKRDESFEILGRMDNSDARGCNLLLN